jgi:hypothetical protein
MTKYQLAKLVALAGGLSSRKRVQKIVCLLQVAGMDFNLDFRLHHYGPYSAELAALLDEATQSGILFEEEQKNSVGTQYNYQLSPASERALDQLEKEAGNAIQGQLKSFESFKDQIAVLVGVEKLWILELGSTIAHYYSKSRDWGISMESACEFKKVSAQATDSQAALHLAKQTIN